MSLSFCLRFIRPVGSMGLWVVHSRRAVLGKACFYDTEASVAVPVHVIPAAKVCRAGGKRCMEASSEIRLKFGGKNPKNKQKTTSKKPQQKTLKQQKIKLSSCLKTTKGVMGTKRQDFTTFIAFRVPLMVLGFGSAFVCLPRPIYF